MLEYLESLLIGTGHDLDLRTFKLVDQLSGRMMGVRADITPQVARIDAHLLNEKGVTRMCYAGSVLNSRPRGLNATREPLQIGAEIYGHAGIESDLEIQKLLADVLSDCGIVNARLDLGHVGVFRALCRHGAVGHALESELYEGLQAKDMPRLGTLTTELPQSTREALLLLPLLYGDAAALARARHALPAYPEIVAALADLAVLSQAKGLPVSIDLADLRGYHYHSGAVFSAYVPGLPNAIALGGRYDEVGKAFERARPATGFSMDLRDLARIARFAPDPGCVSAPYVEDAALAMLIAKLRAGGEVVVVDLPGHRGLGACGCDRELVLADGQWRVSKL
jgi:ATP phosphoribosyltransferase regulatory subunit